MAGSEERLHFFVAISVVTTPGLRCLSARGRNTLHNIFETENVNLNTSVITNKQKIEKLKKQINIIYGEIKKNEKKPSTSYLFNGLENNNAEKTANKLDKLNMIGYIPRS